MTESPDQLPNLLIAAQRGDRAAFGRIYDLFARALYGYLLVRTGHRESAEDLLSTVWLKALAAIRRCPPDHLQAWLYTIARNTLIDRRRRQHPEVDWERLPDVVAADNPAQGVDLRLAYEHIRQSLAALTPEQREVIILRLWDQLSFDEIAQVLGRSATSCRMLMSRGVQTLRQQLPSLITLLFIYAQLTR